MEFYVMLSYSILGWVIGFIGGMVGLVLGVIRLPLILGAVDAPAVTAGTNLAVSTQGAIAGSIRHYRKNNVDFRILLIMSISGAVGAFIGGFLTQLIPLVILLSIITIIVSYEAIDLFTKSRKVKAAAVETHTNRTDYNTAHKKTDKNDIKIFKEIVIGFGAGLLGGMVGLVLGSIRMPAMITILKLPTQIAVGTNLASSSMMGSVGAIAHLINNNIDYLIVMLMGPSAMLGAVMGANFTNRIKESNLKLIISIVLILVAIAMFYRVLGLLNTN